MTTMSIEQEALDHAARRGIQPTFGYYRQPNGWITVSPMTQMEELKYRRRGWEPLPQYGRFDMSTDWAANHPLELLLMMGGAHELPVEQVVQMGLYLDPPLVPTCRQPFTQYHKKHEARCWRNAQPVAFPQLAGVTGLGPFDCRFCDRGFPTEPARSQHEAVAHKTEKGEIRTGETLASALLIGLGAKSVEQVVAAGTAQAVVTETAVPEAMAALLRQMEAMQKELASLKAKPAGARNHYIATCEDCGQEFRSDSKQQYANAALRAHRRAKHVISAQKALPRNHYVTEATEQELGGVNFPVVDLS